MSGKLTWKLRLSIVATALWTLVIGSIGVDEEALDEPGFLFFWLGLPIILWGGWWTMSALWASLAPRTKAAFGPIVRLIVFVPISVIAGFALYQGGVPPGGPGPVLLVVLVISSAISMKSVETIARHKGYGPSASALIAFSTLFFGLGLLILLLLPTRRKPEEDIARAYEASRLFLEAAFLATPHYLSDQEKRKNALAITYGVFDYAAQSHGLDEKQEALVIVKYLMETLGMTGPEAQATVIEMMGSYARDPSVIGFVLEGAKGYEDWVIRGNKNAPMRLITLMVSDDTPPAKPA